MFEASRGAARLRLAVAIGLAAAFCGEVVAQVRPPPRESSLTRRLVEPPKR
jgi:hypothetical protein